MKQSKKDREIIQLKQDELMLLKDLLDIKQTKCYYCKEKIKKGDKFGIFNKPTRLICVNELCLCIAMAEDDKKKR